MASTSTPSKSQPKLLEKKDSLPNESSNWLIHLHFVRNEFDLCLTEIEKLLAVDKHCEFALFTKALIKRFNGDIQESLELFEKCYKIYPSATNLKQIGRSFYLLGKHKAAIAIFDRVGSGEEDWEIAHNKGLCFTFMKDYNKAIDCFKHANSSRKHECSFIQLGKLFMLQENYQSAIDTFEEALDFSPNNPEILTTLGLLYLRIDESQKAFEYLARSHQQDPANPRTILAVGSIVEDHGEVETALAQYRIAAVKTPNSPQLWNNIGMCFFEKKRYSAAIASLKKALYFAPFQWIIHFNLGLTHLTTEQFASAFHFFSAALNLKPDFPSTYMYLGIALSRLHDYPNALKAFEKCIKLSDEFPFRLNYAIIAFLNKDIKTACIQFGEFDKQWNNLSEETKASDAEIMVQQEQLRLALQREFE